MSNVEKQGILPFQEEEDKIKEGYIVIWIGRSP